MSAVSINPETKDTLWKVLPRSATQLERDLLTVTNSDEARAAFEYISRVKRELEPDEWLGLLLSEYGFAEAGKYFKDHRVLVEAAKSIRGKKGTPYSIEEMARIMQFLDAEIWEEPIPDCHFSEFQLNLNAYEWRLARLITLRQLVDTQKPERCRFRRVYNDVWDDRHHRHDEHDWDGESLHDDDSGINILPLAFNHGYRPDDRFLVSLGIAFDGETETVGATEVVGDYGQLDTNLGYLMWQGQYLTYQGNFLTFTQFSHLLFMGYTLSFAGGALVFTPPS